MGSKELIKLLEKAGFKLVSVDGSHHKYRNAANVTVIVPHPKKDLPTGTLHQIMKHAGLK
ncbi:type II toxin-antitoxin system HicA family toxin [Dyella sp. 2RAF44]|uniref:type II toxin-antitoxin system HicA family toxin n=1 Tax=Dyella sp. 2RAF44 TaxID=3233000 RepID=UPI003F9251F7